VIIFKFGGASVKDANSIRNLAEILKTYENQSPFVVISAMGKTTNFLERIAECGYDQKAETGQLLIEFHDQHLAVCKDLCLRDLSQLTRWFEELEGNIKASSCDFSEYYDQIIPFGELYSTHIIASYLSTTLPHVQWIDAREVIATDDHFRGAQVDWDATGQRIADLKVRKSIYITQGFIGACQDRKMTSLGREGSDYSAAIFASCLNAEEVIFWKDVPGIMNADPKLFSDAEKFDLLSYQEATEMTYYGAKVIHSKTLKPLAQKKIPLKVKSFIEPSEVGTTIFEETQEKFLPTYVFRPNQVLVTLKSRSNEFTDEKLLIQILTILDKIGVRLNMMQRSALSFSFCTDDEDDVVEEIHRHCHDNFEVYHNQGLQLATVKNFNEESLTSLPLAKEVLLEQITRFNYQRLFKI